MLIYLTTKFDDSVHECRKNSKRHNAVRRAAILIHWFMQSKSGPAPPENEPVASDRRAAYLWRFCNGISSGNYKVSQRYHILWGRSILASVCFCFYHRRERTVYRWNISVYSPYNGTVANSFVGNSNRDFSGRREYIAERVLWGGGAMDGGSVEYFFVFILLLSFILCLFIMIESISSKNTNFNRYNSNIYFIAWLACARY